MALNTETKAEIVAKYQRDKKDTGSPDVQIALLSANIASLTEHLKVHAKDKHSRLGLIKMVNQRRKLLDYIKCKDFAAYAKLIKDLGIRK